MIQEGRNSHYRKAQHSPKCKGTWFFNNFHVLVSCLFVAFKGLPELQPTWVCHKISHHLRFLLQVWHSHSARPFSAPCLQSFQPWGGGWEKTLNLRSLAQNIHTKHNSIGSGTISAEGRKANKGMWAWLLDRSFIKVKFRILSLSDSTELKSHTQWKQDISYTSEK